MLAFKLDTIEPNTPLDQLNKANLRELQRAIGCLGYPIGATADGQIGPKTRNAWAEFGADIGEGDPSVVSANAIEALKQKTSALDKVVEVSLANTEQVKAALGAVCKQMGIGLKTQIAYVLATAEWETAHTFKPVKEAFWLSENWRKNNLSYYPFYGRGYVQLTWQRNYEKYSSLLDRDMVANTDIALEPSVALFVIVHGFKTGTFTERKITEFINGNETDYKNARRCINGLDKWSEIKELATHYEGEL